MSTTETLDGELVETTPIENNAALMALNASEIDTQIATAKQYPRSLKSFRHEALEMVTLTDEIAGECIYSLPRGGKAIEGPSARFAEVIASAWGNCRAGARIIGEDDRFVTAQGVFSDLQRNVAITYEVKRRITDRNNRKFKDDMIGVTANAACSIALRNAVLKGVPKAFWRDIYAEAKKCAIGDVSTLATKRASMLQAFGKMGVLPEQIFRLLQVEGEQDITLDHLGLLRGSFTALKEGDTTIEQLFDKPEEGGGKVATSSLDAEIAVEDIVRQVDAADSEALQAIYDQYVGPESKLPAEQIEVVSRRCAARREALQADAPSAANGELFETSPEAGDA